MPTSATANRLRRQLGPPFASINEYERKIYSQNGEDGIIEGIFRFIGTTDKFVVEFGVGDGHECNSAQLVRNCGWSALMMEADAECFQRLVTLYGGLAQVLVSQQFITAENIAEILEGHGVKRQFDLLSIDVDGNDYWIWRALAGFRPRVVIIEYNSAHPPPERWIMRYDPQHRWDGTTYFGASLCSLADLGNRLGYELVGTDNLGVNAFFVRKDLAGRRRGLFTTFPRLTPEQAYHPPGFLNNVGQVGHPPGTGPFVVE